MYFWLNEWPQSRKQYYEHVIKIIFSFMRQAGRPP